jgi:hypothetical protein
MIQASDETCIPFSLSYVLSYDRLSFSHKHFSLSIPSNFEPKFFHQTIKSHISVRQ